MKAFFLLVFQFGMQFNSYAQNENTGFSPTLSVQQNYTIENQNDKPKMAPKGDRQAFKHFRLTTGMNYANISGDNKSYDGGIAGFIGGFNVNLAKFGKSFILDGGLFYSQQGSLYKTYGPTTGGGQGEETITTRRLNCLNLPLSIRYQPKDRQGFFAEAGMQGGLLLSANETGGDHDGSIKDIFNSLDAAVLAGAGYQFNQRFKAGVRAVTGFTNVNKKTEYSVFDNHMVVSALISYVLFKN